MATGAAAAFRKLPEESQAEIKEVAKEPGKWGESIERAWDTSKIGAEHFKDTAGILAPLLLGRRIDKDERKRARENLAALSLVVPPLRVFMIPGSHKLGRLCDRFDIHLERAHRADVDAGATLLLLWKIIQAYPRKFRGTVDEFIGSLAR